MMRSRVPIIIGIVVVVLIIGLLVGWFFLSFERVQIEERTGANGMARVNPFYAAELFLDELDIPTESRYGLGVLPPEDHSLIVLTMDRQARRALEPELRDWVSRGGHLVVAAVPPNPTPPSMRDDAEEEDRIISVHDEDPLLVMAGLTLARTEASDDSDTEEDPVKPSTEDDAPDAGSADEETPDGGPTKEPDRGVRGFLKALGFSVADRREVSVVTPNGTRPVKAELDTRWTLVDTISESHLVSYDVETGPREFVPVRVVPMESGWVTAFVDPHFMTNDAIGEQEHARLLYELTLIDFAPPTGAVLVVRAQADSLFGLLWRHGWMVILSLALLLLAWVWGASHRFGPILPRTDLSRRSLMEHIEASGNFLWRHGYHELLLASAREALRYKLAARLGGDTELEGDALEQAISAETGVRESRVHQAFYGGKPDDKRAFVEAMQELQRLWRAN